MGEALFVFVVKLVLAAVLPPLIMGGFALFGHQLVWWLAAVIALVAVFGGWLIVADDGDHSDWFS
jgi:hypothetical protein